MTQPRSNYVAASGHEIHVTEWGSPGRPALIMWHGLARTGRDFDEAAAALSNDYFILCPDTLGRGLSSWAKDAKVDYSYRSFGDMVLDILDHYRIGKLRWIGTSMGGLIGVTLAAGRLKDRITHLVVNDIGPWIPESAVGRIASYVGNPPVFETMSELSGWLRQNYAPFGKNSEAFWQRMTDTSARRTDAGKVTVHYDPQIVTQFTYHKADLDCWPQWDALSMKILLLRGQNSDVLPGNVAGEMLKRNPRARLHEFAGVGHAPTLASSFEIGLLREFLGG